MQFKIFVKIGTIITGIILVIITMINMTAFMLQPSNSAIFTNSLLLLLMLVQLLVVSILINIYESLGKGGRKR